MIISVTEATDLLPWDVAKEHKEGTWVPKESHK